MYDKSETYSVEGDNAELGHYLARPTWRALLLEVHQRAQACRRVVRLVLELAADA